jgi:hypothetical protein
VGKKSSSFSKHEGSNAASNSSEEKIDNATVMTDDAKQTGRLGCNKNTPRSSYSIVSKLANPYGNNSKEINKKLFSFTGWWQGCYQEIKAKVSSQFTLLNIDEGTLKT